MQGAGQPVLLLIREGVVWFRNKRNITKKMFMEKSIQLSVIKVSENMRLCM